MDTILEAIHKLNQDPKGTLALGDETGTMIAVLMTPQVHQELLRMAGGPITVEAEYTKKRKTRAERKAAARIREQEAKREADRVRRARRAKHTADRERKLRRKMPSGSITIPNLTTGVSATSNVNYRWSR